MRALIWISRSDTVTFVDPKDRVLATVTRAKEFRKVSEKLDVKAFLITSMAKVQKICYQTDVSDLLYCSWSERSGDLKAFLQLPSNERVSLYLSSLTSSELITSSDLEFAARLIGGYSILQTNGSYMILGKPIKIEI